MEFIWIADYECDEWTYENRLNGLFVNVIDGMFWSLNISWFGAVQKKAHLVYQDLEKFETKQKCANWQPETCQQTFHEPNFSTSLHHRRGRFSKRQLWNEQFETPNLKRSLGNDHLETPTLKRPHENAHFETPSLKRRLWNPYLKTSLLKRLGWNTYIVLWNFDVEAPTSKRHLKRPLPNAI